MKAITFIVKIVKKFYKLLVTNVAFTFAVGFLSIFSLLALGPIIDFIVHPDLKEVSPLTLKAVAILQFLGMPVTLTSWVIIFMVFIVLSSAFHIFAQRSILRTIYAVLKDLMMGTFNDFFSAGWYFFSSGKQGVLLNTFIRELNIVGTAFSAIGVLFAGIMQALFYLVVPFYISWKVTLVSLALGLLFAVPFVLFGRLSYRLGTQSTSTANVMNSIIHEDIGLAKIILGFGNQEASLNNLRNAFDAHARASINSQILNIAIPLLYRPFGFIMIIIALFTSRIFRVPLSETAVLLFALLQVAVSIGNLTMQKNALENLIPSYEQIDALRQRARSLVQRSGPRQFTGFKREILIEKLGFSYPDHGPILQDINAIIPKGKMIAFVGESGSGKSTLIDMIMGFHEPSEGKITIDGVQLKEYDIQSYRKQIGYVPQDSALFNTTIKNNLLWACDTASDEEINRACREAGAEEFINGLPQKYNTLVGDRGVRLSGGQVQRIALARAVLRKPDLLILDEATSSLDSASERMIQEAVERIAKETTIVVIAHRLSTIVNADYIYVIKKGQIVEGGTYPRLVQLDGHFNQMVKLQLLESGK